MLNIRFIVVDRTRSPFLAQGESFYLDRLKRYVTTEWIETKPAGIKKGRPVHTILAEEGDAISKRLLTRDFVIALDRAGKEYGSEGLAARIEQLSTLHSHIVFIIGGPLGLSGKILENAHETLSLSKLTLTHEMSRLLLLEQLYRAFTIINNEKYHK
ncbi:Ribosomal RNA large subunit methyltransferase H [uncultured Desulfobacterium sp.]|uniref:Ribosomal RNA large subunit methyltransferase H n=1 Tax=uncultured Desulfobacterium sp. TaxID=201089 RepID=A0A445MZ22_9BACT|nr:Ribosomal RNA large subunit methyltransferase H [uncultured Desulfobacterium sp.]